jgi:hypothetical protein
LDLTHCVAMQISLVHLHTAACCYAFRAFSTLSTSRSIIARHHHIPRLSGFGLCSFLGSLNPHGGVECGPPSRLVSEWSTGAWTGITSPQRGQPRSQISEPVIEMPALGQATLVAARRNELSSTSELPRRKPAEVHLGQYYRNRPLSPPKVNEVALCCYSQGRRRHPSVLHRPLVCQRPSLHVL